ncbi:MAG: hypothetical protein LAQ69_44975 [Acidobacteriia bacterium]|nr:hypothetical protein [Terriglobia bacterium]
MKWVLASFAVFVLTASAADVTGTWKAIAETSNGNLETTFVFRVDGTKLTGTTSIQGMGVTPISEGKIDGDNLSFLVAANLNGKEVKLSYKGKVTGNEMKITLEFPNADRPVEMTAKKIS